MTYNCVTLKALGAMNKLTELFREAKQIFTTHGLVALVRQGFSFVIPPQLFEYGTYYLYEDATENITRLNEADFMPKIDNFTLKIVSTNHEADELEAKGLEFRSHDRIYRDRLDKGAIAFCIFVGRDLAHVGWVAMNEQAQKAVLRLPLQIKFSNDEAFSGGSRTNRRYRGNGLHVYSTFKLTEYLCDKGRVVNRGAVQTSSIVSQKTFAKFGHRIYAEARYLKILWWKSWKEKLLP
ncbi:hypothetical protein ACFLST_01615 [Chloroflexota bacterium]